MTRSFWEGFDTLAAGSFSRTLALLADFAAVFGIFAHALAMALVRQTELTILHVVSEDEAVDVWTDFPPVRSTLERWGLLPAGSPRSAVADGNLAAFYNDRYFTSSVACFQHPLHPLFVALHVDVTDGNIFFGVILTGRLCVRSSSFAVNQDFFCHAHDGIRLRD